MYATALRTSSAATVLIWRAFLLLAQSQHVASFRNSHRIQTGQRDKLSGKRAHIRVGFREIECSILLSDRHTLLKFAVSKTGLRFATKEMVAPLHQDTPRADIRAI